MQGIHKTGYCHNNLKLENVMIIDQQVILVGFGHVAKFRHSNSFISRNHDLPTRFKTSPKKASTADPWSASSPKLEIIDDFIEQDKFEITSPCKDLASIYLMMITLLLNENYSAFESFDSTSEENDDSNGDFNNDSIDELR